MARKLFLSVETMRKVLVYFVSAVLLGAVTMVAPLALLSSYEGTDSEQSGVGAPPNFLKTSDADAELGEEGALQRALRPSNLSSVGLMLIPSFLTALGAFLYLKRRD